jgi:DNA repair photolyase
MGVTEIQAKSLLRIGKKTDSWFVSRYHLNLYRGCGHNCLYCDGRAEKYAVSGEFGCDVAVKTNALDILKKELDQTRRRKPLPQGFVCFGGGVGDAYQPVEKEYSLARQALLLLHGVCRPVHILTKSALVERDLDVLEKINSKTQALVSMSFSSVDDTSSRILEPGVPSPSERLRVLEAFKKRGLACGMYLMPVVPFLTDSEAFIDEAVAAAAGIGLDWVIFAGMTLKKGRQADYFYSQLEPHYPELVSRLRALYESSDQWGMAPKSYYGTIEKRFLAACKKYKMPARINGRFFADLVSREDLALVLLEQIDYLSLLQGQKTGFGYAAYVLSKSGKPLAEMLVSGNVAGVNAAARRVAQEILATGTSQMYEKLMAFGE